MKINIHAFLVALTILVCGAKIASAQTVATDQSDYAPGSTVNITGAGFAPGETVQLQVLNVTDPTDIGDEHAPWTVTADTNGNFTATWYVTDDEANMTLQLTATGLTSGLVAQKTFTDSVGTPTSIGQANSTTSGTTLAVTVPAGGVAVGNTIIFTVAINTTTTTGTITVADTQGNTYTQDANVLNSGVRTLIFSAPVTTALVSGNTITVTFPTATSKAISAYYVSGLVSASRVDQTHTGTGTSTAPSSGATATTTQASELVIGAVGAQARTSSETMTAGGSPGTFTLLNVSSADNGTSSSSATVWPEYQIVSATGTYTASGTFGSGRLWAAAVVTYKAFLGASQLAFTTQPVTTTAGSTMANVVVQIQNSAGSSIASNGVPITLTLSSGSFASGTLTVNSDSTGKATFNNLDINTAGTGYTITAAASGIGAGLTSATSSSFNINAGAATQLSITNTVVTVTAGVASSAITVQRQDAYGNPTTNGTTTVNLTTSSATGSFTNAAGTAVITSTNILPNASTASYLYRDTVAGSPTITNSVTGGSPTSDTQVVTVIPAAASKLVVKTEPSATATAGVAFTTQPAVYVEDQFGNVATNDSSTVTAALATGTGPLQGTTTATPSLGVVTFNNLADNLAESIKLKYTDGALTPATNTTTIVVSPAAASKLVITSTAVTVTAGVTSGSITVQRQDSFGNPNTTDAARTVTLSSTSTGTVTFNPTSLTISTGSSSATFTYTDTQAGTPTITAASTSPTTITSATQAETVNAAAASKLIITSSAVTTTAGVASSSITVQRQDQYGNPNTTDAARTVTLASTSTGTKTFTPASPLTISTGSSSATFTYTDTQAGTPTITTASTSPSTITSATQVETVNPGAVSQLIMNPTTIASATAGTSVSSSFTSITAEDTYGNICSSGPNAFTGTVAFAGTAGATGTSAAFTAGVLTTFPTLTPTTAGSGKTITATTGAIVGTTTITTVNPGVAAKLAFTTQPGGGTGGTAWTTQPVVTVQDANGNTVTTDTSTVTVAIGTNPGGGTLGGTLTKTAVAGVASFSGLSIDKIGTGYTLGATDGALTSSTSGTFNITVGPAAKLAFTTQPGGGTGGTVWTTQPVVTVQDAGGNTVTTDTSTVTLAIANNAGPGGVLSGTLTKAAVAGVASFSANALKIDKIGTGYTLGATDGALTSVTSGALNITLGPLASYSVSAATATRGTAFNVTVTALDAGGNTVTTDNSTAVTLTSSTGNVSFTGNPVTLTNGTFTISSSDDYFETVTLTATDVNTKTGNTSVTVNPASGDYRSQATGNWGTAATWQTWSGSAWATASSAPASGFTGEINVQGGFTVTVAASASVPSSLFVVNSGSTVSISSGFTLTVGNGVENGVISGAGVLAENGTGTTVLTLNGNNTYSGGTIITGDTVSVTNVNSTGNQNLGSGGITFASGGTLLCGGPSGQSTAKAITLNAGGGVITMSGATITLTGTISGGGGLTSSGSDLILAPTSANTIGTMTVNSGRLFVNSANAIANSAVLNINSGGTLDFQYTATPLNTMTFASGACLANRSGTLTVSTANVTFPSLGTMIFNQDDVAGTPIIVNGTYPTLTGALTIQVGGFNASVGTVTLNGTISGSYGITKTSTGTLVLGSANTYTGGTTISGGFLTANVTGSLGSGALSIASGATNTLANGTTETVAGLFLGGTRQIPGSWGGTGSSATHINTTYFVAATGVLNAGGITVTAQANTKNYDGTTNAAAVPTITTGALAAGDTATLTETYNNKNQGTGKTLTPTAVIMDSTGTNNVTSFYTITYVNNTSGVINKTNLTVTAATNTKNYDGGTTASAVPTITAGSIQTGDTAPTWTETYASKNAGTGLTLTPAAGVVNDGNSGLNYNYTYATVATGVISQTNLTVTAVANTKIYNGTTSAAALPTITAGSIQTGDTAPTWTETYNNKNAGTGKTLTPAGVVTDGNSGANYNYTYATVATGVISQTNLTVTAVANTKIYNGTTSAAATPTITAGTIQTGDTAPTWTETYDTKNQGSGKTLTPAGVVTDGNSGLNYNYTYATVATGVINKTNITVTAAANTKNYDGGTTAAATPTVTSGTVQTGDTANFTETYNNKNVGNGNKTLTPSGTVTDGNSGNNYNYTFTAITTGTINATNLTVTAAANTKNYDGTVSAAAAPTVTAGSIQTGDTAPTWTETYNNKNAGSGKTLTPAGVVSDGNSGANYNYTYATVATGVINQTNLTVTAATNTKNYNGTTSATAVPTVTAGSIQTGDTAPTWTETYDTKNQGSGKTLTPAGVVNDGNSGLNYSYTYATVATGVINKTNLTVTAVTNTKNYDGTVSAAATPTVTAGSIQTGDTAPTWTETYDTKNQGSGKTLTPAGLVNDGNSGLNYNYTYTTVATGVISKTNITVTAASQTKNYDGTTSSTGTPTITSGSIQTGDSAPAWTQTFDSSNASAVNGRTLTPAGVVSDGNGGANYNYTYATATGTINKATATVVVTPYTVTYDGSAHTATVTSITGVNGETGATVGTVALSTTHTVVGTFSSDSWSFTGTANYNNIGSTTITDTINKASSTVSQSGASFTYNAAKQTPTISFTGSTGAKTTNYIGTSVSYANINAPTNAGTYYVSNTVASDANYNGATNALAFTVSKAGLTLTPGTNVKTYDGTTAATNVPTATGLQGTDTVSGTMVVYAAAAAGTGLTLSISAYTVNDNNAGNNYTVTANTSTGGTINKASTTASVASSLNPSGYRDSVSFTAGLPADATGSVIFVSTNGPISTNALTSGSATSLSVTNLPRGTNVVSVQYAGDSNYLGLTNLLAGGQIVTNHPPVITGSVTYTRSANSLKIFPSDLITNATDVDGDTLTMTSTGVSTNGITLQTSPGILIYVNTNGVNDAFTYTVSDGFGGSATGTNYVNFAPFAPGLSSSVGISGGVANLVFHGIPAYRYGVQRSTNLMASWDLLYVTNAPANGAFIYTDNFGTNAPASAFYRLIWNP